MRCTRCDRIAVPQALGRDPSGDLIFGWCVDCLKAAHCTEIEIRSARSRDSFDRLMARPIKERVPSIPLVPEVDEGPIMPGTPGHALLRKRRRYALLIAGALGLWGMSFLFVALCWILLASGTEDGQAASRRAMFLGLGGGSLIAVAGFLAIAALESAGRIEPIRRAVRIATPILIALILIAGIVFHSPKRDPWFVALAFAVLVLGGLAGPNPRRSDGL
jgi:hypothetical protein